jgi:hypothetical protein
VGEKVIRRISIQLVYYLSKGWLYKNAALRWLWGGIFVKPLMAGIICVNGHLNATVYQ